MVPFSPTTNTELTTGKPITQDVMRRLRDDGYSKLPDSAQTNETDTSKVLSPNGSGGAVWTNPNSAFYSETPGTPLVLRLGAGKTAILSVACSGGGQSGAYRGGNGHTASCRVSHPTGGSVEVALGSPGAGGAAASDSTVIVKNSGGTEVARLTIRGGAVGGDGSVHTSVVSGTLTYFNSLVVDDTPTGQDVSSGVPLEQYVLTGQYVHGKGGDPFVASGAGVIGSFGGHT